jgi:hypothetical protein
LKKKSMVIAACPFAPLKKVERDALAVAARHYGDFVGAPVEIG